MQLVTTNNISGLPNNVDLKNCYNEIPLTHKYRTSSSTKYLSKNCNNEDTGTFDPLSKVAIAYHNCQVSNLIETSPPTAGNGTEEIHTDVGGTGH
jgi:hypothetical protein